MTQLLVSVRDSSEVESALAGGADVIDVKDPTRGSLGRADESVVRGVVDAVAGRKPVSAAWGELSDEPPACTVDGLAFVKWGPAGCASLDDWQRRASQVSAGDAQRVAVAYADHRRANSPPPFDLAEMALRRGFGVFLLDTWEKDGTTLLDWLPFVDVDLIVRMRPLKVALGGSLREAEIRRLKHLRPDWIAVRAVACVSGQRHQSIDAERVRQVKALLS